MEIIQPQLGLFFWTGIIFLVFFFLLRRFAWKPIINALNQREQTIEESLMQAQKAREEMEQLKSDNEALLKEARGERDKIIKEANELRDKIVSDAKTAAAEAEGKEREKTRQMIESEKRAALSEIKNTAATIAVEVAEKILRKEFADKQQQTAYAQALVSDLNEN